MIGKTAKRYARLANGNVRNFYELQGGVHGSRVWRGLVTPSQFKVFLTTSIRRSGISVPRFLHYRMSLWRWRTQKV